MNQHSRHPDSLSARPLLFYVTDRRAFGLPDPEASARLLELIENAARAGVDAIQIREKDLSARALFDLARRGAACCARLPSAPANAPHAAAACGTRILVNDRLDVALAAGAAGVHLGGESVPVADVTRMRPGSIAPARSDAGRASRDGRSLPEGFLVGRSCHSLAEAVQAERDGADYIFFGPVFATPSKARFGPPQGIAALAAVCPSVRIPVIAIGGITVANSGECIAAGASGVAAIRLFQEAKDLAAVVQELKRAR